MSIITQFKEKITKYLDVYIKLFKINFIGRTANLLSYFMFAMISLFFLFCILLFLGLGLTEAFIVAGLTKMSSFFLTIGVYFVFLVLLILLRKNITRFFSSAFIKVLTEGDEDEEEKEEKEQED